MSLSDLSILAIIQAVLEWLPVSSEGFLVLAGENAFEMSALQAFQIAVYFHLGTALAVFIKFRKMFWDALFGSRTLLRLLILSTIGTAIVGIPLYLLVRESFSELDGMHVTLAVGIALLVTATLLRYGRLRGSDSLDMEQRKVSDELGLGLAQGFAILPGISRSGLTITYLVLRGFKRKDAFVLSFLISLPAVIGAVAFDLLYTVAIKHEQTMSIGWDFVVAMGIVAVLGYAMMNVLLKMADRLSFDKICYILGGVTIALVVTYYIAA
ncbi:MAG: undecaprenyl-diphosphate phosphatase [Chloroflexi bacterium]|jgi:undecaprenyl-diphosphatase|nr:undecaprenyl-diphosphate phosphatase [Chloroflexota bacterium]MBT7082009.1 undecaprenyl-diphosphate phosphatase [Chloroflexota bacterium]MBT7289680.1 undecaprenyl-diphosphate phosphatase [Chloroflexota bacterium]